MRIYLIFLNFLFCFFHILNKINYDSVENGMLNLPRRGNEDNVDLLELVSKISKLKEEYSMTEVDTVYLIFKWISRTLQYDCYGKNHGGIITEPFETYKKGKGGYEGLTQLFTIICGFLNIESNTIVGIDKYITYNFTDKVVISEKYWNIVLIEDKYYILDIVAGMGYCNGDQFCWPQGCDVVLFGLNPEIFIRHRFPNDSKWQLLSNPITKEEFIYLAYLLDDFHEMFKAIYPDVLILKSGKELVTIKLTFDKPIGQIDTLKVFAQFVSYSNRQNYEYLNIINQNISNGILEFSLYLTETGFLTLSLSLNNKSYRLVWYMIC